jgi:hypothetical protein
MVAAAPRRNAKQEKHDREFNEFLSIRSEVWEPVWTQGRILYEEAQALRLQGDHLGVVARFRQILALQATARASFAELIKGNPNKNPGGACGRAFEDEFDVFAGTIEYQLAHPLTLEECRGFFDSWEPWSENSHREVTEGDRTHQKRKVLAFHQAGGCTGYSDTVELVYTTPFDDFMDGPGYRWGMKPWGNQELHFKMAPPDGRGCGYWLMPWGEQIGAQLLQDRPDLLVEEPRQPAKPAPAPRKAAKPRRTARAPIIPVWIRDTRGHILAGGMPLFPDFLEAQ